MISNLPTIYVDPFGHGNYSTVQSAIDSVPQYNENWICIYIKAGTYRYSLFFYLLFSFLRLSYIYAVTAVLFFIIFLYGLFTSAKVAIGNNLSI